jgi:hypothetical protein
MWPYLTATSQSITNSMEQYQELSWVEFSTNSHTVFQDPTHLEVLLNEIYLEVICYKKESQLAVSIVPGADRLKKNQSYAIWLWTF